MKANPGTQLNLLENSLPTGTGLQDCPRLVIELDHRTWMRFLSEEWLFPDDTGRILLGLNCACNDQAAPELMTVGVWFDPAKLPPSSVMAWRENSWSAMLVNDLAPTDTAIYWDGPLPLFAVDHFTVDASQTKAHLLAMVRNFADIELPSQPVEVEPIDKIAIPMGAIPPTSGTKRPPANWDALRGAASMALSTVPAIGPWLQVLCGSLSSAEPSDSARVVHAPWLRSALWSSESQLSEGLPPLWGAMIGEFSRPGLLKEWKPRFLLDAVVSRARSLGDNEERLERLIESTTMLLQDRGTIGVLGLKDDPLGLVLQLVLLRPSPERFVGWKDDWPAIPPGAWWTGATLTGYLSGFRALPLHLRGSFEARKLLALRTWDFAGRGGSSDWGALCRGPIDWRVQNDSVILQTGHKVLAEHKFSNRGRWYEVNLNEPTYREGAKALAQQFCPDRLRQTLVLEDGDFEFLGSGQAKFDAPRRVLSVKGKLEIPLGLNISIASQFDVEGFRDWLATASMPYRLPRPPTPINGEQPTTPSIHEPELAPAKDTKKRTAAKGASARVQVSAVAPPNGLLVISDFISPEEESALLETIDTLPWDGSMSRRVQHYGWRYDYKTRKVDPAAYIGPLPSWANLLGKRLLDFGVISEFPDQVIVNEYIGPQGIAKHIDCPSCFRGAIVTISLNESWEMFFSRRANSGNDEQYKVLLERRSAAVLDGEARSKWQHEIPRRAKEAGVPRGRRVSITFRKVATQL